MNVLSGPVYDYACSYLPNLPGNYFEIGVFNGTGFARVAKENFNKKCYAVDPFIEDGHTNASSGISTGERLNQQKLNYLENTKNLTNTKIYETTSTDFLQNLSDQECTDMNISMVVIDGNHHYDHVCVDFNLAIKLIGNKSGYIIVDDTDVSGVLKAFNEFKESYSNRIEDPKISAGSTQVLIIKESNE